MENKELACIFLEDLLNECSREKVDSIKYNGNYALITYPNGYVREVNIAGDSVVAMLLDILKIFN